MSDVLSVPRDESKVQSAIGDAIFQITGKRFRDLPFSKRDLRWT